ncbi:MAG: amino acid ABC transporter substrate-binding protein [Oscillatoriales cyanobacterium RM2_1_1]|nr:amino acid ABC transporter substrate-binding protein [Oscillatoriales cyanobacterium RM2_1_1]
MFQILIVSVTSLGLTLGACLPVKAESASERIKRTGVLNAGVRMDAVPFSYLDQNGRPQGYAVELTQLIQRQLEQELGKPIQLNLEVINLDNRFEQVQSGQVDLYCGATSITPERERIVDFSIPFFTSGIQLLVRQEDALRLDPTRISEEELQQAQSGQVAIGFLQNTTTDTEFREVYPGASWQALKNRAAGVRQLRDRSLSAIASDGILLLGELWLQGEAFEQFRLVPEEPLTFEDYGCILPEGDQALGEIVNQTITSPANTQLWQQWFDQDTGRFPYKRFGASVKP